MQPARIPTTAAVIAIVVHPDLTDSPFSGYRIAISVDRIGKTDRAAIRPCGHSADAGNST
jgi:hypothetical protein